MIDPKTACRTQDLVVTMLPNQRQMESILEAIGKSNSEFFVEWEPSKTLNLYAFSPDGRSLGIMTVIPRSPFANNAMEIGVIEVFSEYRKMGVGSALLETAFQIAAGSSMDLILGFFTQDGEQYLDRVSDRLWEKYPGIDLMC